MEGGGGGGKLFNLKSFFFFFFFQIWFLLLWKWNIFSMFREKEKRGKKK